MGQSAAGGTAGAVTTGAVLTPVRPVLPHPAAEPAPPGMPAEGHPWSEQEKSVLARAASQSCTCGCERPWTLHFDGPRVVLTYRPPEAEPGDGGSARDRLLACGCALAVLTGTVRVLGWMPEVTMSAASGYGDEVMTVTAAYRHRPTTTDARYFRAVFSEAQHRTTLDPRTELSAPAREEIIRAAATRSTRMAAAPALARAHRKRGVEPGMLVLTLFSGHRGSVLAGVAMQRAWLAAASLGLTAAPLLEPFEMREFRQRVSRHAGVEGIPQGLLMLGRPAPDAGTSDPPATGTSVSA